MFRSKHLRKILINLTISLSNRFSTNALTEIARKLAACSRRRFCSGRLLRTILSILFRAFGIKDSFRQSRTSRENSLHFETTSVCLKRHTFAERHMCAEKGTHSSHHQTRRFSIFLGADLGSLTFEQLSGDDHALNFAGAFADGAKFHVAVKLFRRIIFDEAVAAVNLDALVRAAHGDFAGVKFRH